MAQNRTSVEASQVNSPLLTTTVERRGEHVVVQVSGEVDMTSAPLLDQALADLTGTEPAPATVVADLTKVRFFGSSGLSVLLTAHQRCGDIGIALVVVTPSPSLARRAIEVDRTLTVTETLNQALDRS